MMTKQKRCTVEIRLRRSVSCGEHLKVGDHKIFFQPFVKTLGVFFNSSLTMSTQLSNLCHTAYLVD